MTAKELASQITLRRRKSELTKEEKILALQNDLLIILAASDDGLFLEGAIQDEYDRQSRYSFHVSKNPNNGLWQIEKKRNGNLKFSCTITKNGAVEIKPTTEHSKISILDEDAQDTYCIGAVLDLKQFL